jgi:signal transduction histidine kinase
MLLCRSVVVGAISLTTLAFAQERPEALNRRAVEQTTVNPQAAMDIARRAEQESRSQNNVAEQSRALNTIGLVFWYQDRYDSAESYLAKALSGFERLKDVRGRAEVLLNLGSVSQSRADYTAALEYDLQALALYESLNDTAGVARALANVGIVHTVQGAFDEARKCHRKSLSLRNALGDKRSIAHAWRNLGSTFLAEHRADSAATLYNSALTVFEEIGDKQGIALSKSSMGAALQKLGRNAEALQYQEQAAPLLEQLGDKRGLAVLYVEMSASLHALGKHLQALERAERARALSQQIGAAGQQRDAQKALSEALAALGRHSEALEAHRRYATLKDSLFTLQTAQNIATLQTRYELAKQAKELTTLEQQRNVEALKVQGLWGALIGASLFFIVIMLLLANRYRLKKRSADALAAQNTEILRQRELLEVQSEEIHRINESLLEVNSQLAEQNQELQALNAEKNEFLGIAAHDLKNPLSNILLTADLLGSYYDTSPRKQVEEWTSSITKGAEYMLNIITTLLDVNKVEQGKMPIMLEPIEAAVVEYTAEAYRYRAEEKRIALSVEPISNTLRIVADRNALQQVLENLVSNAIKFSPPETTVRVAVEIVESSVRICVQDQGPGISAEDQKKLFGKFARLSAQPTGGEHSTGLGLSIVKKLVEAMQGNVWCESELGKGATFVVALPQA